MTPSGRSAEPEVIWARPQRAGRGPRPPPHPPALGGEGGGGAAAGGVECGAKRRRGARGGA
ncbi:TetR/AcrR family transcriptional regulator, partial [Streptomyces goshikiensis]